jgi:hypothetical protein
MHVFGVLGRSERGRGRPVDPGGSTAQKRARRRTLSREKKALSIARSAVNTNPGDAKAIGGLLTAASTAHARRHAPDLYALAVPAATAGSESKLQKSIKRVFASLPPGGTKSHLAGAFGQGQSAKLIKNITGVENDVAKRSALLFWLCGVNVSVVSLCALTLRFNLRLIENAPRPQWSPSIAPRRERTRN